MAWNGRDCLDHLVPTTLLQAGTPLIRPGCSKLCPAWTDNILQKPNY